MTREELLEAGEHPDDYDTDKFDEEEERIREWA
jgi:hypothetical protein